MPDFVPVRSIKTSDYVKTVGVEVDGKVWKMRPIGAADELALSQIERRVELYDKKLKQIKEGTAAQSDVDRHEEYVDRYEKLENKVIDIVCSIFTDETANNSQVREWALSIPMSTTFKIIEDIALQSEATTDGADGE